MSTTFVATDSRLLSTQSTSPQLQSLFLDHFSGALRFPRRKEHNEANVPDACQPSSQTLYLVAACRSSPTGAFAPDILCRLPTRRIEVLPSFWPRQPRLLPESFPRASGLPPG